MKQGKEFWYDAFNLVGNEHLIAVELNFVSLDVQLVLYLGEVKYAGEVEGIVYIKVDPEEGLVCHGVELTVEFLVVLILQFIGFVCPQWLCVVNDIVLFCFLHLFFLFVPFAFLAKGDSNGQEVTVFLEQGFYLVFFQELLAILADVHYDVGTSVFFLYFFQCEFGTTIA